MSFLESFLVVAQKVALLAVLIGVGYICQKLRILDENSNKRLADLVMYFVTPCVIINAFSATLYPKEELIPILKNIGIVAIVAVVLHVFMILCVGVIFKFKNENYRKVMRFATVFSNSGFIALPLAQSLIDTDTCHEGALYAAVYLAIFNIVLWTWGLIEMSGDTKGLSAKKIFLTPGLIGVVVGLIIFTTPLYLNSNGSIGLKLPSVIADVLSSMSALNLPLPMFMVGFYLASANLLEAFKDIWSYLCLLLRLIVFPLIALAIMYMLGIRGNVLIVCVIGASAPVGATTTIFSAKYNRDTELSVRLVSLSTLLSMLTMPLIIGLTQMLA